MSRSFFKTFMSKILCTTLVYFIIEKSTCALDVQSQSWDQSRTFTYNHCFTALYLSYLVHLQQLWACYIGKRILISSSISWNEKKIQKKSKKIEKKFQKKSKKKDETLFSIDWHQYNVFMHLSNVNEVHWYEIVVDFNIPKFLISIYLGAKRK